jgi:hypothetical protein
MQIVYSQECILESNGSRPTGLNLIRTTDHFMIHYTTDSENPNVTTENFIDIIEYGAESARAFLLNEGWQMPPSDGDNFYDIYIEAISKIPSEEN